MKKFPIEIEGDIWNLSFESILLEEFRREYSFSEAQNINSWEKLFFLAFLNKNVRKWLMELKFRWKAPFSRDISGEMPEYYKILGTTLEEWENVKWKLKNYESSMQAQGCDEKSLIFSRKRA